ncbi:MAG: uncharacterized protein QG673_612 [Pseudomonadota bacterium]|nr:uncharacterized protein [Pseudomonadota bacterium]
MYRVITILLLTCSNVFMTFAWYGHLKTLINKPVFYAILISWGLAFFEYCFQVPANRIGFEKANFNLMQLKIIQEVVTLSVFVPFVTMFMGQKLTLNYLWACICILGAVYFIFKN